MSKITVLALITRKSSLRSVREARDWKRAGCLGWGWGGHYVILAMSASFSGVQFLPFKVKDRNKVFNF